MGTNYYIFEECESCGARNNELHIGKSSAGWCFSLHIYPDKDINTLDDWIAIFESGQVIQDEYGRFVSAKKMISNIAERGRKEKWEEKPYSYPSWEAFHQDNHSQRGPNGLLRHRIGNHCNGHGDGTYDYIQGEFS